MSRATMDPGTPTSLGRDGTASPGSTSAATALPARDLLARLAYAPAVGPVALGYGHGLLCATLTELTEERFMRDVIASAWATHLGVSDTPEANASVCFAALADVIARLIDVADAIRRCMNAAWAIDPDGVALGFRTPSAPVAAVCLLPRDVRLAPRPHERASHRLDEVHASIWPTLDPLVRAWCRDGDLDLDHTWRTLGRPTRTTG
jgi:uncharacterized protein (DUF2236 family)